MFKLSIDLTVRPFFDGHFVPFRRTTSPRWGEKYERALDYWESLTDDPPLGELEGNHRLLADFKMALAHTCWRCLMCPCICERDVRLSANSVAAQLKHVQYVIDFAGPADRKHRQAAGLLQQPPWVDPPKYEDPYHPPISLADVGWVAHVADQATLPHRLTACTPGDMWRGLLVLMRYTTLRIGQCLALPWSAIDLGQRLMVLPAAICRKSKKNEPHPITAPVVEALMKLRGETSPLVFGALAAHSRTAIWEQLHRLQTYVGVSQFGFHDIRRAVINEIAERSPAAAQLAAGHGSYKTTMLYQNVAKLMAVVEGLPSLDELIA